MDSPKPFLPVPVHNPVDEQLEAYQRSRVVDAALSWTGTPYRQMACVKGPKGGVDCAMLLVAAAVEARVFEPFDPRPYPSNWFLHRSEERYLGWMETIGEEVKEPVPGDIVVWQVGRCFAHSGILTYDNRIVHSFAAERICTITERDWEYFKHRPTKYFDIWARLRG